jgi:hypothetical protein
MDLTTAPTSRTLPAGVSRTMYSIPKPQWDAAKKGIEKFTKELGISMAGPETTFYGTRPLKQNTKKLYNNYYNGLRFFLSLIQDHMSLIILDECAPEADCPSMDPMSIRLFHRYKTNTKGSILTNDAGDPVYGYDGKQITCSGTWTSPNTFEHLQAAVSLLHTEKGHSSEYIDRCDACWNKFKDTNSLIGCPRHAYRARLFRKGDPFTSPLLINTGKQNSRDHASYVRNGNIYFFEIVIVFLYSLVVKIILC